MLGVLTGICSEPVANGPGSGCCGCWRGTEDIMLGPAGRTGVSDVGEGDDGATEGTYAGYWPRCCGMS